MASDGDELWVSDARGNLAALSLVAPLRARAFGSRGSAVPPRAPGDGRLRLRLRLERAGLTAPALLPTADGSLALVGSQAGRVWAVTAAGKVAWFWSGAEPIAAPPLTLGRSAPHAPRAVVVVAAGSELIGLDVSGQRSFSRKLGAGISAGAGPIALGALAVVGDGRGTVLALDADGKSRWERDLGSGVAQLVALPDASAVAARLEDGRVVELAADGELLCEHATRAPLVALAPAGRGSVATAGADGAISLVDLGSGRATRALDLSGSVLDLALAPDGSVVIAVAGGELIVLEPESV